MNDIITLSIWQVALAYSFIVIVLLIVRRRGIRREKDILLSSVRMTLQLVLTGYVLNLLFGHPHPALTIMVIILMEVFAIATVIRRQARKAPTSLKQVIALAMIAGTLSCLLFFLFAVIQLRPWYDPRYFIPLAGMLIGNSMTGISLAVRQLQDMMDSQRPLVEQALMLGATPSDATRRIINQTFDSAIMPTINSMLGMGIIFLPGMMTGQILSGTLPTTAIAYQIAIMLAILGAVSLTVLILLRLGCRSFFTRSDQLIDRDQDHHPSSDAAA